MTNVIDYVPGNTLLHRLNPVAKLALAAALIVATFLADTYALLFVLLALTFSLPEQPDKAAARPSRLPDENPGMSPIFQGDMPGF